MMTMKMPTPPLPPPPPAASVADPPLPPDHYPATVYRYTKTRGWERYRSSTPQSVAARSRRRQFTAASQQAAAADGKGSTAEQTQMQTVCAVPRRGCVEVRALRLRIRLFAEDDASGGGENSAYNNHNAGGASTSDQGANIAPTTASSSRENTLVIRRSSRVLLSSRRNLGAVVFKFRSVPRAVDFCSRLMELNAAAPGGACTAAGGDVIGSIGACTIGGSLMSNPMSLRGPPSMSAVGAAMLQASDGFGAHGGASMSTSPGSNGQQQQQGWQEADTASYMVRLLHDQSFLTFVNSMEDALTTSVAGGELMLKALAMSSATAPSASSAVTTASDGSV